MSSFKSIFSYLLSLNIKRPACTNSSNPKILIIPYDAVGDMVMTIPLLNTLHKIKPNWQLEILSSSRNKLIIEKHPALSQIYTLDINSSFFKLNKEEKLELNRVYNQNFDILIYLGERLNSATLWRLSNIKAKKRFSLPFTEETTIKKGVDPLKSHLFDRYIGMSGEEEFHFCKRMLSILPDLNIKPQQKIDFSLHLPSIKLPIKSFSINHPAILFNPLGSQKGNSLTSTQTNLIIEKLQEHAYIIYLFDTPENKNLIKYNTNNLLFWLPSPDILIAAEWIKTMDIILTTDTSIGHISAALSKETIIMRNNEKWRDCCDPLVDNVTMLRSKTNDINTISIELIMNTVQKKLSA